LFCGDERDNTGSFFGMNPVQDFVKKRYHGNFLSWMDGVNTEFINSQGYCLLSVDVKSCFVGRMANCPYRATLTESHK
jgi:hypothetical protein